MAVLGAAAGGGGGGQLPTISFMTSQTWTPSYDLTGYVYVIGGGGSGGVCYGGNGGACGGGAGGCAVSKLDLSSGTTYTITIGAGGAAPTTSSNTNGNTGGATSFAGSGISTMTGNGGAGGVSRPSNNTTQATAAAGGTATGGTLGNFTGGKGAGITSAANNVAYIAGGGGAVGLWATGNDAVDAITAYGYTVPGAVLNVEKDDLPGNKFYNRMTDGGADDHEISGYPTIEAFTGVLTTELSYSTVAYSDYDHTFEKRTGALDARGQALIQGSKAWGGMSAPFQGANGWSGAYGYGQRGCAGSGGGGCYAHAQSDAYGGAGGNGLVLIFPVSLGA